MDIKDLENRFKFHPAKNDKTAEEHSRIRYSCLDLAKIVNDTVPESREKSLAITHLEQVMMWANAGIARHGS
ncbi:MAG TPA: hypothetical protein VGD31_05545 [Sphingobacteriaceae bacterium]